MNDIFLHFAEYEKAQSEYETAKFSNYRYYYNIYQKATNAQRFGANKFAPAPKRHRMLAIRTHPALICKEPFVIDPDRVILNYYSADYWRVMFRASLSLFEDNLTDHYKHLEREIISHLVNLQPSGRAFYVSYLQRYINKQFYIHSRISGFMFGDYCNIHDASPDSTIIEMQSMINKFSSAQIEADKHIDYINNLPPNAAYEAQAAPRLITSANDAGETKISATAWAYVYYFKVMARDVSYFSSGNKTKEIAELCNGVCDAKNFQTQFNDIEHSKTGRDYRERGTNANIKALDMAVVLLKDYPKAQKLAKDTLQAAKDNR